MSESNDYPPPIVESNVVRMDEYAERLRAEIPGLVARTRPGEVQLSVHVATTLTEYAFAGLHADEILAEAAEQLRQHAIHELGLQPRLDAWAKEVRDLREANRTLDGMVRQRDARIGSLLDRLEALENPEPEDE